MRPIGPKQTQTDEGAMTEPVFVDGAPATPIERSAQSRPPLTDRQWVRLVFPGISDRRVRFDAPLGGLLADVLKTIIDQDQSPFGAAEVVTFPGQYQQEYLLFGYPAAKLAGESKLGMYATDHEQHQEARAAGVDTLPAVFGTHIADAIIDRIGVEIVDINLTPLGYAPTATSRLLSTTTDPVTLAAEPPQSPFAAHIQSLGEQSCPHLARTVLGKTDAGTYHVDQQIAYFERDAHLLYADAVTAQYRSPPQSPRLADGYATPALTTNIEHICEAGWNRRQPESAAHPTHSTQPRKASGRGWRDPVHEAPSATHTVVGSHHEFAHLLGTTSVADTLRTAYAELGVAPTIELDATTLAGVLGLTPNYDYGPWFPDRPPQRTHPALTPRHVIQEASGTDHEVLAQGTDVSPPTAATTDDSGFEAPNLSALIRTTRQSLAGYGDRVSDPSVNPFGARVTRTTPAGATEDVLIGTAETIAPGPLLQALRMGSPPPRVTVVVDSLDTAEDCRRVFDRPFRAGHETWTTLFTQAAYHWCHGEALAVVPRDRALAWQINPEGQLRLRLADAVIAAGPPETVLEELPSNAWLATEVDDQEAEHPCAVFTESGKQYEELPVSTLVAEFQPIPLPLVPQRLSYLDAVSIFYLSDGVIARLRPERAEQSHRMDFIESKLSAFLETHLRPAYGNQIPADTFAEGFQAYLHPHTTMRPPTSRTIPSTIAESDAVAAGTKGTLATDEAPITDVEWPYPVTGGRPYVPGDRAINAEPNRLGQFLTQNQS